MCWVTFVLLLKNSFFIVCAQTARKNSPGRFPGRFSFICNRPENESCLSQKVGGKKCRSRRTLTPPAPVRAKKRSAESVFLLWIGFFARFFRQGKSCSIKVAAPINFRFDRTSRFFRQKTETGLTGRRGEIKAWKKNWGLNFLCWSYSVLLVPRENDVEKRPGPFPGPFGIFKDRPFFIKLTN